jgi:hypothetical protein
MEPRQVVLAAVAVEARLRRLAREVAAAATVEMKQTEVAVQQTRAVAVVVPVHTLPLAVQAAQASSSFATPILSQQRQR